MFTLLVKAKTFTIFATILAIASFSSAYHHSVSAADSETLVADSTVEVENSYEREDSLVGATFDYTFNPYFISPRMQLKMRSAALREVYTESASDRKERYLKELEEERIIEAANKQPKHVVPFESGAWANSKSRYQSWLNANREIKPKDTARRYAALQIAERDWNMKQWPCLDRLWWHESNWGHTAGDASGKGAYGIPQAAPGKKMASAGDDWKTSPITQIDWGLDYIKNRYGTPCKAWNFWAYQAAHGSHGWGWY